jgi:hypothetical protein
MKRACGANQGTEDARVISDAAEVIPHSCNENPIEAAGNDDLPGISENGKAGGAISTAPGSEQAPDTEVDRLLAISRSSVLRADTASSQTPPAQPKGMLVDTAAIRFAGTRRRDPVVIVSPVITATALGHMTGSD